MRARAGATPDATCQHRTAGRPPAAPDRPWRFWLTGEPTVSPYRPASRRGRDLQALTCATVTAPRFGTLRSVLLMFLSSPQATPTPGREAERSGLHALRPARSGSDTPAQLELTRPRQTGKFLQVAPRAGPARDGGWVRLMFENSTVCHSRRISLLCPVLFFGLGLFFATMILAIVGQGLFVCWVSSFFDGEFDPGSGRTLAACLTHASRAERPTSGVLERRTGE